MVRYYTEDISFNFKGRRFNNRWLKEVSVCEGKILGNLSIVFCSDPYIISINKKYLSHDYFTDIITFDYCLGNRMSGDLFISVDSVRDNSVYYGVSFEEELHRVIVHGLLHLIGYDDHTEDDIKVMREKENYYLVMRKQLLGR